MAILCWGFLYALMQIPGGIAAPTATAWIATHYSWQAAILATAGSAVIGILAWLAVKPDVPLKLKSNKSFEKVA